MIPFPRPARDRVGLAVTLAAVAVALVSARPYAGAWNDGSRLATVEALVDHGTLAIDHSIFVAVPEAGPYPPGPLQRGTMDKLLINGHYYSDKSPVPSLLLALVYLAVQGLTGLTARGDPATFCYLMTVASAGVAYVVAVACVYRLGLPLNLPRRARVVLAATFALATVALVYVQHVNQHILLLGVAAALMLQFARLADESQRGVVRWQRLAAVGALAGLGYTIDLGAGPPLLACTLALVAWRGRGLKAVAVVVLATLPWLVLHHAVNHDIGGTFRPANANPEYFLWDGCPFGPHNMTGVWQHNGVGGFLVYATALLFGKHGFVGHNLPLLLALGAVVVLLARRAAEWPEVLFAALWCGGTWLAYALTSRNYSGQCCSVRWFVPLLAPAFYVLAVYLREVPRRLADLALLGAGGAVMMAVACWYGPWIPHLVPGYWVILGATLMYWVGWRVRQPREPLDRAGPYSAALARAACPDGTLPRILGVESGLAVSRLPQRSAGG